MPSEYRYIIGRQSGEAFLGHRRDVHTPETFSYTAAWPPRWTAISTGPKIGAPVSQCLSVHTDTEEKSAGIRKTSNVYFFLHLSECMVYVEFMP